MHQVCRGCLNEIFCDEKKLACNTLMSIWEQEKEEKERIRLVKREMETELIHWADDERARGNIERSEVLYELVEKIWK